MVNTILGSVMSLIGGFTGVLIVFQGAIRDSRNIFVTGIAIFGIAIMLRIANEIYSNVYAPNSIASSTFGILSFLWGIGGMILIVKSLVRYNHNFMIYGAALSFLSLIVLFIAH